jgi:hypothetical protein
MIRRFLPAAPLAVFLLAPSLAAQTPPMPELSERELHARAAMNANALMTVTIADQRARGVSPREWGLMLGQEFAASWGANQTPQSLARGMWINLQSIVPGVELEVGEYSEEAASIRMPANFPAFLEDPERWYGITRDDYRETLGAIAEGIAARFDMHAALESRPDAVVLRFSR